MDIRNIALGEVVGEPGAYRMPLDYYHTQAVCPGPSISSSGLRSIAMESPWHFWAQSELNPARYPDKAPNDGMILGKAAHCLLLGDEVFDEAFVYVPKDAPRRPTATQIAAFERDGKWSAAAADGAAFWAEFDAKAAGRHLLPEEHVEKVFRIRDNLMRNPLATTMLTGGLIEISMIWQDDATGIWLKSRPDVLPDNGADFADLKTFAPTMGDIKRAIHKTITDRGYAMQMALAIMGAEAVFGRSATECVLVMCQTTAPFTVSTVRLDEEVIYWAKVQIRHAIDLFAACLKSGEWPMPIPDLMTYSLPDSVLHRLGDMQINGLLPNIERTA
jgi:hypothetical protein